MHVTLSSWRALDDTMIPSRGKISAAFINVALARTQAQRAGFDEAILLDQAGHVAEGPLGSLFIVRDGVFITTPSVDSVMEGVTRRTAIELIGSEMKMDVVERPIERNEIYLADEALLCGTGIQIGAVTWADHTPIGSGTPGGYTERLRELYFKTVRRGFPQYADWCVPVYETRTYLERPEVDERRSSRARSADL